MRTLATAVAMATVLTVPAAARTLLKNPQRLLPDYVSISDVKNIRHSKHDQAAIQEEPALSGLLIGPTTARK